VARVSQLIHRQFAIGALDKPVEVWLLFHAFLGISFTPSPLATVRDAITRARGTSQ
jgi:hypothetical protein